MPDQLSIPPKPITEVWRPELVALPKLTFARRVFRQLLRLLMKFLILALTRSTVTGMENFPKKGPAVVVINHLGDADAVLLGASIPYMIDAMGKIELNDHWLAGPVLRAYGLIWVHRGRPDRKALRSALDGLAEGRLVTIAPEGRQSLIGGLEEGNEGAAFLALKSGAPILPIAMTGTENANIWRHVRRFKRAPVTLAVGKPFFLREHADRQEMMREGTRQIMQSLADLLPESYRGNYR
ncbi:MAG TPA: lysophospholipid acyltransferase family protein [Anaerolineales bacterium]|nr:lysophospholipid acyltransferase family protein [Anaerolineales bacterium]